MGKNALIKKVKIGDFSVFVMSQTATFLKRPRKKIDKKFVMPKLQYLENKNANHFFKKSTKSEKSPLYQKVFICSPVEARLDNLPPNFSFFIKFPDFLVSYQLY